MANQWAPSFWGRKLTRSSRWRLSLQETVLSLSLDGLIHQIDINDKSSCHFHTGLLWTDITFHDAHAQKIVIDGLPNAKAALLRRALEEISASVQRLTDLAFIRQSISTINNWLAHKARREETATQQRRWFTHEMQSNLESAKPRIDDGRIAHLLQQPLLIAALEAEVPAILRALEQWKMDHRPAWKTMNANHTERELKACKSLFDRIERQPLTVEQAKAAICFDNRVQVIASAGSGKTSTMVAKAAYAIDRGIVDAQEIIILAFNKQAANELGERCKTAFTRAGFQGAAVETSTFHALGLTILGKASGRKPNVPVWAIDQTAGILKLRAIVGRLTASSTAFFVQWNIFRFVFNRDLPAFGVDEAANAWDAQGNSFILTIDNHRVRSQEEAAICNWLFLNGVNYRYEAPYEFDTADENHRQYHPDFYYPDIGLYHEHFALNASGHPPEHFTDYLAGVEWKRALHKARGTAMIETTSAQLRSGNAFEHLTHELTSRGITLNPDPHREAPENGEQPMKQDELLGLMRMFISHAKSNVLSINDIRQRLSASPSLLLHYRNQLFLNLVAPVLSEWDAELASEGGIDFEDMLNMAAESLESGRYTSPFALVMADEFQDASYARARLCRALMQKPGQFLFTVGDDWQSINRFAGADLSVMSAFHSWFGDGQTLKLERTFRCPQPLCDISSQFISRNPNQIGKNVHSTAPLRGPVMQAFQVEQKNGLANAIDEFIMKLAKGVQTGEIPAGIKGKVSVFVLGRYNADRQYLPERSFRFSEWLDVSFLTIHRAKGSEADYVILPEMVTVRKGRSFPNTRYDDPVLTLAMPEGDHFPHAEERRLFYVAMTRARRSVAMFTVKGRYSVFLEELLHEGALSIIDAQGKAVEESRCPACRQGAIVLRKGPHGSFHACSNYPDCCYKPARLASTHAFAAAR